MRAPLLPREFPEVFHARGNGRKSPGPSDASFRVRGSEASRMPVCRANPALVWPLTIDQSSCVKFGVFDGRLSIINDQLRGLVRRFTTEDTEISRFLSEPPCLRGEKDAVSSFK